MARFSKHIIFSLVFLLMSVFVNATVFTVTKTADSGSGSLRNALQMAAFTAGPHTIVFDIPQSDANFDSETGVWTISPASTYDYIIKSNVTIDGTSQTTNQGDTNPLGPEIYLNGNSQAINYCFSVINASHTVIKGFIISGFMYGIQIFGTSSTDNAITGNYIGTNHSASIADGNYIGIEIISGANYTTVGGNNLEDRNIVSGNEHIGIRLLDVSFCNVLGNFVGVDRIGTSAIPNYDGISLEGAVTNNIIGGELTSSRNIVSGNVAYGIPVFGAGAEYNSIIGNYIGTDISGSFAIPNTYGVLFDDGSFANTLGGSNENQRNILSGNSAYGVFIYNMGTNSNIVSGNFIGTDKTGTLAIPNAVGIVIDGAAFKHRIQDNVISGNLQQGIYINITGCDSTQIIRNKIGVNIENNPLGNGSDGIRISQGPKYSIIGGSSSDANIIAFNGGCGVYIMFDNDDNHLISFNAIYNNVGLGIDLFPPGVNQNDVGDIDAGANQGMNFPEVENVIYYWGSGDTEILGTLDTENPELCTVQAFKASPHSSGHGQAIEFLDFDIPDADGNWLIRVPMLDPEQFYTCLAIDENNNTSEFSITRSSTTISQNAYFQNDGGASIYPNPVKDYFYLSGLKPDYIEIYNSNSSLVSKSLANDDSKYNVSELKSGVYFVKIIKDGLPKFIKIVITK